MRRRRKKKKKEKKKRGRREEGGGMKEEGEDRRRSACLSFVSVRVRAARSFGPSDPLSFLSASPCRSRQGGCAPWLCYQVWCCHQRLCRLEPRSLVFLSFVCFSSLLLLIATLLLILLCKEENAEETGCLDFILFYLIKWFLAFQMFSCPPPLKW